MQVRILFALIAFAALTAFGCSPTQIGDRELKAEKPLLNSIEEYGEATLNSNGENLKVTIKIPPENAVCTGNFKMTGSDNMWPVISILPGFASVPQVYYEGAFDQGLPAKCLALLGKPGGTPTDLILQTPVMLGSDNLVVCAKEDRVGKSCAGKAVIYIVQDL